MSYLLDELDPKPVWRIFEEISRIPRCSKHEEKVQSYIKQWASENRVGYKRDGVGNVLITREPSQGCSEVPPLMFQAHQDMVCEKTPESSHDFSKDPIPLMVEDGKVKAYGTSLGADNGLGMALAMAILVDPSLSSHGRLEALFTVDEEAGFTGVRNLEAGFFTAKHMINLDSEEAGVIIVSSAGGGSTTYTIKYRPKSPDDREAIRVSVDGLLGGHSGVDIHLPRYNANNLLAELLKWLHSELTIRLIRFEGGTRSNVIPRNAYADILVPFKRTEKALELIHEWSESIDKSNEPGLTITGHSISPRPSAPVYETEKMINLLSAIPFGPKTWSQDYDNLVQTSNNTGIVQTVDNSFIIKVSSRTSKLIDGYENQNQLEALGQKYHVDTEQGNLSAGWTADPDSKLLKLVEESYDKVQGGKPVVTGIHGGLECGVIAGLKQMDIVSVGPTIKYPHSPSEYVVVDGVENLYKALLLTAKGMKNL